MTKPIIHYFSVRGRGEPIKLTLAAKGIQFEVAEIDYAGMKSDLQAYPFGQAPRYVDDEVDICQSNAICRHLGRKHDMYGASRAEAAVIDEVLDGVEDVRRKYLTLVYQDSLADDKKAAYWEAHCDPASAGGRNGGAHLAYLSGLLKRNGGGSAYVVGSAISIADTMLFDLVDLHLRIFEDKVKQTYPELAAHHERIAAIPGVKAYLEGPLRLEKVNGNGMG